MRKGTSIILGSGVGILIFGVVFGLILFPFILQSKIKKQIRLEEGGELFNKWVDVKFPIYMKVYLFTIQNPEEFTQGEKPILKQVGPWVYQQKRQKVVEHLADDKVLFRPKITYFFRPDMSEGRTEEDVVNFINVPLLSVASSALKQSMFARSLIKSIIEDNGEKPFVERTVGELLFHGYYQPTIADLAALKGEELMPDNKFGFFYNKNGTAQDLLEIYSGVLENEKFGETVSWQNQTQLSYWSSPYCNMINGSDGSIFPHSLQGTEFSASLVRDMCRSIYMTYVEDVEIKGIKAYRFTTPKEVLQDPRIHEENLCYCREPGENFEGCTKAGVFRIGACKKDAPIVASWPHFYDGDEEYQNQSVGLNPSQELHETFLSLEPNTGALLQASKRFQINLELVHFRPFPDLKKMPKMILPLLWADESVSLTDETAEMLKGKLFKPMKYGGYLMDGLISLGAMLIVIALIQMALARNKKPQNK